MKTAGLWIKGYGLWIMVFVVLLTPYTLILNSAYAMPFVKTAGEQIYLYEEFSRSDGNGWLASDETLLTQSVKCYLAGTETTSAMISNTSIVTGNQTASRVRYLLKAGTAGKTYLIKFVVTTSAGQTFETWREAKII